MSKNLSLKKTTTIALTIPLLSFLLLFVPTAAASSPTGGPTPISGSDAIAITASTSPIPDAANLALYQLAGSTYTGSISGTAVSAAIITVHPDNTFVARLVETFTGTIAGSSTGTATIRTLCAGTQAAFTCVFAVGGGEGGLTGVRAKGTVTAAFTGQSTISATYRGLAWFGQPNNDGEQSPTTPTSTSSSATQGNRSRPASGNASVTVTASASTKDANGNTITYLLLDDTLKGTISGTAIGAAVLITQPDGTTDARAATTFTGHVLWWSGTAAFFISATGKAASITGQYELTQGHGGLAGLEVEGPFSAVATSSTMFAGPYYGHVQATDGRY